MKIICLHINVIFLIRMFGLGGRLTKQRSKPVYSNPALRNETLIGSLSSQQPDWRTVKKTSTPQPTTSKVRKVDMFDGVYVIRLEKVTEKIGEDRMRNESYCGRILLFFFPRFSIA